MYSDFFDPPDDAADTGDKRERDVDKIEEDMDYGSDGDRTGVSDEEQSDKDKADETDDDDDYDDDDKQPPVKKAKHKLLADE